MKKLPVSTEFVLKKRTKVNGWDEEVCKLLSLNNPSSFGFIKKVLIHIKLY